MLASTSTSRSLPGRLLTAAVLLLGTAFFLPSSDAFAAYEGVLLAKTGDKHEEEDHTETPYTEYGEFNEEEDEAAETRFFQFGRFFGVSIGVGYQGIIGNRAVLYQGGLPALDFKVHYWFDFHLALDINYFTVAHFFDTTVRSQGHVDVNMARLGVDLKYYFDTKNVSAAISFSNPYLIFGLGSISKTEYALGTATTTTDSALAMSVGGGLEFVVSPRRTYLEIEGKASFPTFQDSSTTAYQAVGIDDLTGIFYTFSASMLFTW
jgi:hypothetical protein